MKRKIYKKYYPLVSEEELETFINENGKWIRQKTDSLIRECKVGIMSYKERYLNKMKDPLPFWGGPATFVRRTAHNESVALRWSWT